ncbi:DUF4870 domain-containing protein [Thermogemmatispora onikobensis]|uniref:DUF4870 domain-containing protein n=1 Tax=Thermogemmatispora onikobensis TaxID=732234 RepID=UPI000852FF1A|nr:hypothetical protein [Thermogemmatispora onikobensis]
MLDDGRKDQATVWQTRSPFEGLYGEKESFQQQELLMDAAVADQFPFTNHRSGTAEAVDESPPSESAEAVLGMLSYLGGWLSGLLVLLFGSRSRLVRFHALQSLFFFGLITLIDVSMLMALIYVGRHYFWWYSSSLHTLAIWSWLLLSVILQAAAVTGWLIGMIQGARRRFYLMPVVGRLALALVGQKREIILK